MIKTQRMHYATVRQTNLPPNHGYPSRARRNTIEPGGRPNQSMIQLVKASQQQQYAYEYMDDRGSFVRAQQAEEERIQQDMERAMRAQRRNRARKVARASKAAEPAAQFITTDHRDYSSNGRRPSFVGYSQRAAAPMASVNRGPGIVAHPHQSWAVRKADIEKSRMEAYKFPLIQTQTYVRPPPPIVHYTVTRSPPPLPSPSKHLAPIPGLNPFVRARSESLSSLLDEGQLEAGTEPVKRKRAVSALFARIHREAANVVRQIQ